MAGGLVPFIGIKIMNVIIHAIWLYRSWSSTLDAGMVFGLELGAWFAELLVRG